MNRHQRRCHVKRAGGDWHREQRAKRHADEIRRRMSPEEARRMLAEWAAVPGRTQAEVDVMNGTSA